MFLLRPVSFFSSSFFEFCLLNFSFEDFGVIFVGLSTDFDLTIFSFDLDACFGDSYFCFEADLVVLAGISLVTAGFLADTDLFSLDPCVALFFLGGIFKTL